MTYSVILLLCLNARAVQWMSAYESFNDFSYTDSDGWFRSTGTNVAAPIANCPRNGMSFTYLDKNYLEISKSITNIAPHYQIRMVAEIYYSGSLNDEFGKVYFNNALIMNKIYDYQDNMTEYQNLCGLDFNLTIFTAYTLINPHTASSVVIKLQTDVDSLYTNEAILIRNVQVFILKCHASCKTCNNPDEINCQSCFLGGVSGGKCKYCSDDATGDINLQYTDIIYGCVQECSRTNYIAVQDKLCQYDQNIYPKFTYYDTTSFSSIQMDLIIDPIFTLTISPRVYTFTCNSESVAGPYFYNEGIQKVLTLPSATQKIRFRATFYLLGTWDEQAQIQTLINNISFGQIYYEGGVYKSRNSNIIYSGFSGTCNSMPFEIIRTEQIMQLTTNNIVLQIIGSNNVNTIQGWAIRDIYIDVKVCSLNCDTCDDTENCLLCTSTFLLYKGQCVSVCPPHSKLIGSNCNDFDQETLYTSYLIKEFYDLSTSDYVAQNIFDLVSSTGTNFIKGVYYSYIPNVRVFGGSLTWLKAKFSKTFPVTAKHYSKRVRFLVIFGDNFGTGQFKYQINSGSVVTLTRSGSPNSQIWGDTGNEYFYQVNVLVPDGTNSIFLSVECLGPSVQINEAFCAIQNLFITLNECPTFCNTCDNSGSCTSWQAVSNFNTLNQDCDDGYYLDSSVPSCKQCVATGCQQCDSSTICTLCESSFILSKGQCECKTGNYLTTGTVCDVCNEICGQCFEADDQSCLSCNIQQNRYLNKHQCICLNHFQQIFDDLVCQPICGDLFTVGDEQCDDGNDIQFDGCHQCKYSCQLECKVCAKGLCEECNIGYFLNLQIKKCQPICNNSLISGTEECDDSSYLSGCVNCQYQCQPECTQCIFGVCYECNIPGWRLHYNNLCQTTCGDGIVAGFEECEDGNILPYDGCHACQYSCVEGCSHCYEGKCLFCAKGWQYIFSTNQCVPSNNNGLIEGRQVCDDGDQYFGDGCYLGEFSCPMNCQVCEYEQCLSCKSGYYLENLIEQKCQSRCGDLIKSEDEECDDLNKNCNNCKLECDEGCATCLYGYCLQCKQHWILNDIQLICNPICGDQHLIAIYEQCDDGNLIDYDGCSSTCEFQCQSECTNCEYGICLDCVFNWILDQTTHKCIPLIQDECEIQCTNCIDGICIKCNEDQGYYLSPSSGKCSQLCGDNKLTIYSNQCSLQCSQLCDQCEYGVCQSCLQGYILTDGVCNPICGDNLLVSTEQCDDGNDESFDGCSYCQYQCEINCVNCYHGICYACKDGFNLNTITSECMPICGDGQIVGLQVCDDLNNLPYDGCFECQFQCEQPCTSCLYGVCYECNTLGYEIIENHCFPICGDSLVIGYEECDDGNLIPYDGCFECHFQCQEPCLICNEQLCYKCELAWILIENQCQPLCGDQIVLPEYEDCDDGNMIPYDGCYDCSYQCQLECTDCRLGICYECNTTGWEIQMLTHKCQPICGDGLVIDIEECDDPDNLGCQDCKYTCHEKCLNCISGICYQCANGWYTEESQCYSICGDGYVTEQEECDDSNLYDLDGCSTNCEIELKWMCETHSNQSYCSYKVDPKYQLEYLDNEGDNQQNITIGFTNGMRKYCEFEFNIDIEGCESTSYVISINPIVEAQYNKLLGIKYSLQIDFSQNCIRPKVLISLNNNQCLMNFYEQVLNPPKQYVILNQINIISEDDKSKVTEVSIFNDIILYSFLALFTLSLMTGGLDLMWNMLDLLQYLSYLQFINVPFPRNLDIYFQVFKLVSIQPIIELIHLDSLIQGDSDLPFVQCQYKFKELNGLFLYNIESLIFVLLSSYCLYLIQKIIFTQLSKLTLKFIINLGLKYANYLLFVRKLLFQSIIAYFTSQQLRILMSNAYDINFSIFIQLIHFDTSTAFLAANSIISLLGLLVYLIIMFKLFQYKGLKYSPLIEGIQNTSHWGREYNCVQLMKKLIFMLFLVLLQTVPIYQSLLISCLCVSNISFILVAKPLINHYEYYKVLLSEGVFCACSLSFILYEINVNYSEIYSDEIYQALGWIHIAMISSVLCISLVIDAKQQIQILIVKFKKYQSNHQHELDSVKPNLIMFY